MIAHRVGRFVVLVAMSVNCGCGSVSFKGHSHSAKATTDETGGETADANQVSGDPSQHPGLPTDETLFPSGVGNGSVILDELATCSNLKCPNDGDTITFSADSNIEVKGVLNCNARNLPVGMIIDLNVAVNFCVQIDGKLRRISLGATFNQPKADGSPFPQVNVPYKAKYCCDGHEYDPGTVFTLEGVVFEDSPNYRYLPAPDALEVVFTQAPVYERPRWSGNAAFDFRITDGNRHLSGSGVFKIRDGVPGYPMTPY